MLHLSNEFGLVIESVADGTQPANVLGTTITPGNNTYGSYASVLSGASLTDDAYMIDIWFNNGNVDSTARDGIATVGFDPAGGTAFGGLGGVTGNEINHLLWSCCGDLRTTTLGPVWYRFPLYIKAGTSIGVKASVNNATVGTVKVFMRLYCKPSRPELVRAGSFVRTFGAVTASSTGTSITPGTTAEGAYTELGTLADTLWYWEYGIGFNNATNVNNCGMTDIAIGDATNKKRIIANGLHFESQSEVLCKPAQGAFGTGVSGDKVYGRMQLGDNAAATGYSLMAYGTGG